MSEVTSFSFPSYRRLRQCLGETDAMVELTELAARHFLAAAKKTDDVRGFVSEESRVHGICVNLSEVDSLSRHLVRSYIVIVYHAAEQFFRGFRREHSKLHQKEWSGDAKDTDPLTIALGNIAGGEAAATRLIGADLITRFQYYRIVRNWVVHSEESEREKPEAKLAEVSEYSGENAAQFGQLKAPKAPGDLDFDDFVLFSRVTKAIGEKMSQIAQPDREALLRLWKTDDLKRFKRISNKPVRMRNAVAGQIKTVHGIDDGTANWIAEQLCGSLAQR